MERIRQAGKGKLITSHGKKRRVISPAWFIRFYDTRVISRPIIFRGDVRQSLLFFCGGFAILARSRSSDLSQIEDKRFRRFRWKIVTPIRVFRNREIETVFAKCESFITASVEIFHERFFSRLESRTINIGAISCNTLICDEIRNAFR